MPNTEYSEEINELFQRIIDKPFNLNVRIQETRIGHLSEPFFFFINANHRCLVNGCRPSTGNFFR